MHRLRSVLAAVIFFATCASALAAPTRVVFYPGSADVTEHVKLQVQNGSASFTIPGRAMPDTMTLSAGDKSQLTGLSWESFVDQDGPAIAALKKQLDAAVTELDGVRAEYNATKGAIAYLEGVKDSKTPSPASAVQMTQTIAEKLKGQYKDLFALGQKLKPLQNKVKELETKIQKASGNAQRLWRVTVDVASSVSNIEMDCTYNVPGSGWNPAYRLDGLPDKNIVQFGFDAVVVQNTGMDLKNVDMALATTRPRSGVAPPTLPEWAIGPRMERPAPPMRAQKAMADNMVLAEAAVAAAPVPQEKTSYTLWELGKRSSQAGKEMRVNLQTSEWPAKFKRTARPSVSPLAFVSAELDLAKAPDLPPGTALFLLDGTLVGRRGFQLSQTEKTLFFGEDPLVEIKRELLSKQSGEKGFIGKSQTYDWSWKITCTNGHGTPISLMIEEPQPQSRDKSIELETEATPKPEIKDKKLVWSLEIPGKGKSEISYSVRLKAPEDMDLDLGWNR